MSKKEICIDEDPVLSPHDEMNINFNFSLSTTSSRQRITIKSEMIQQFQSDSSPKISYSPHM